MRKELLLGLCLILGFTSFSCTTTYKNSSNPQYKGNYTTKDTMNQRIDSEARNLLKKYNLNPLSKKPTQETISLRNINFQYDVLKQESTKIGLNFNYKEGEKATSLKYLLKEKSKSSDLKRNQVYAHVLYKDQEITGAYIECGGYFPSTVGISDRTLLEN